MSGGTSAWTEWEDEHLRRLVAEYGPKKWTLIASKLTTRGSKQCRRRWNNFLNADLKQGDWSPGEDRILIEGHKRFGNKWTEIAKLVGGRTDNAVKNRWAAISKRIQGRGGEAGGGSGAKGGSGKARGRSTKSEDDGSSDDSDDSGATPLTRSPRYTAAAARHGQQAAPAAVPQQQEQQRQQQHVALHTHQRQALKAPLQPNGLHGRAKSSPFGVLHNAAGAGGNNVNLYPAAAAAVAAATAARAVAAAVAAGNQGASQLGKRQVSSGLGQQDPYAKRLHLTQDKGMDMQQQQQQQCQQQYQHSQHQQVQALDLRMPRSPRLQARQQGLGVLGFTSPRTAAVLAAAGLSGPQATVHLAAIDGGGALLGGHGGSLGLAAPPSHHSSMQAPLASPSGSGKKARPELTLVIPDGGTAEPLALAQQPQGLQIHVSRELLSPAEVRYAQELNEMEGIPLHIKLEDLLEEPPLSTSRRAAQDALSALVDSPSGAHPLVQGAGGGATGGALGPLMLTGLATARGGDSGGAVASVGEFGLFSAATPGGEINELLKWLQNATPRSASGALAGGPLASVRPGAARSSAANNNSNGSQGAGASLTSPRHNTRAFTRLTTPRGAAAAANAGGEGAGGQTPCRVAPSGGGTTVLLDGHRQLLSKLLQHARTGTMPRESASQAPVQQQPGASEAAPRLQGAAAMVARQSPRLQAGQSPKPWNDAAGAQDQAQQQQQQQGQQQGGTTTDTQAAAAILILPFPVNPLSATGRRTCHGGLTPAAAAAASGAQGQQGAHPGPRGNLSVGGLLSPVVGGGALSSRGGGGGSAGGEWNGLEVLLTPAITSTDIDQLLELLGGDE